MGFGAEGGKRKTLPDQRGVRIVELTTQKCASIAKRLPRTPVFEVLNKLNNLRMCSYVVRRFANQISCWVSKIMLFSIISARWDAVFSEFY